MGSWPLPPAWDCPETVSEHGLLFLFHLAQKLPFGKLQLKTHDQKRNSLADYSLAENLEGGGRMCLSRKEETEAGARPPPPPAPPWWLQRYNAAGSITMAHLSSPMVPPALGLPVPPGLLTLPEPRGAISYSVPLGHSFQEALGRKQRMPSQLAF